MPVIINGIWLSRWTAALLVISTVLFAAAVLVEHGWSAHERSSETISSPAEGGSAQGEAGERAAAVGDVHAEGTEAGENAEHAEGTILGINLENPLLVWGFAVVSLLVATAVLRFGKFALLAAIVIAAVAAVLDGREVLSQVEQANAGVAGLASLTALAHVAVVVVGVMAWQATTRSNLRANRESL